jgi:hypothetical protein
MGVSKLKKLWDNRYQIAEGIKNSIMHDDYIEEVASLRETICKTCEHMGTECMVPGTAPCCNLCGCSLALKLRSPSSECDLKKWTAVMSQEQEDKLEQQFNPKNDE